MAANIHPPARITPTEEHRARAGVPRWSVPGARRPPLRSPLAIVRNDLNGVLDPCMVRHGPCQLAQQFDRHPLRDVRYLIVRHTAHPTTPTSPHKRPVTASMVAPGMRFSPVSPGRCAGRGHPQQSLRSCRQSGQWSLTFTPGCAPGASSPWLPARSRIAPPPTAGPQNNAPSNRIAWCSPAHSPEQAPPATVGDGSAPSRRRCRCRAGRGAGGAHRRTCSRAEALTAGHKMATVNCPSGGHAGHVAAGPSRY